MSFELREHTADVAVEAEGVDLGETFAAIADGLAAAMCESIPPEAGGERFEIVVGAEGREALLYDYLDELIYQRDVRGVLPVENRATVRWGDTATNDTNVTDHEWTIEASARGVPFEAVNAREIKAVTYSEMSVERRSDSWQAYVVFDV